MVLALAADVHAWITTKSHGFDETSTFLLLLADIALWDRWRRTFRSDRQNVPFSASSETSSRTRWASPFGTTSTRSS